MRNYIRFNTNMHVKIDAYVIRLDCLKNPQAENIDITEENFNIKTIVRETTRSGKI